MALSQTHSDKAACAGRDHHKTPLIGAAHTLEDISQRSAPSAYVLDSLRETRALMQLGTLGGGNHFLEVLILPARTFPSTCGHGSRCLRLASPRCFSKRSKHSIAMFQGVPLLLKGCQDVSAASPALLSR